MSDRDEPTRAALGPPTGGLIAQQAGNDDCTDMRCARVAGRCVVDMLECTGFSTWREAIRFANRWARMYSTRCRVYRMWMDTHEREPWQVVVWR